MLTGTYDPKAVIVTVDDLRIEGFAQDTMVEFEKLAESEAIVGADGHATVSKAPSRAKMVTLTLLETSPGYRILGDFWKEQESSVGALPARPFYLEDLINGDIVTDANAVLMEGPVLSKGARVGTREFKIFLPNPEEQYATNVQD
jgi:hypothetical protein